MAQVKKLFDFLSTPELHRKYPHATIMAAQEVFTEVQETGFSVTFLKDVADLFRKHNYKVKKHGHINFKITQ